MQHITEASPSLIAEDFTKLTFCMLSRTSEVLMVPLANLNLSRLATDSSPASGLMEGTGSPIKEKFSKFSSCLFLADSQSSN